MQTPQIGLPRYNELIPMETISVAHLKQQMVTVGNLWANLLQFCDSIWYWFLVSGLSILEPIIVCYCPTSTTGLSLQIFILTLSSICFIMLLCADRGFEGQAFSGSADLFKASPATSLAVTIFKHLQHLYSRGDYLFEMCCFLVGWIFIANHPGIAALRCFRIFRILWYPEIELIHSWIVSRKGKFLGGTLAVLVRASRFAVSSLLALGREMFTLTKATHGGCLIGLMFFYTAFVMGTALWIETGVELPACATMGSCMFTVMRLAFYDGNGFDYAYSLSSNHPFLFFLLMFYLCVASFGMLNGLIGIFGTAFTDIRHREDAFGRRHSSASAHIPLDRSNRFGGSSGGAANESFPTDQDPLDDFGGLDDAYIGGNASNSGGMFRRHSGRRDSFNVIAQQMSEIARTQTLLMRRLEALDFDVKTLRREQLKSSRKSSLYGKQQVPLSTAPKSPTKVPSPVKQSASKRLEKSIAKESSLLTGLNIQTKTCFSAMSAAAADSKSSDKTIHNKTESPSCTGSPYSGVASSYYQSPVGNLVELGHQDVTAPYPNRVAFAGADTTDTVEHGGNASYAPLSNLSRRPAYQNRFSFPFSFFSPAINVEESSPDDSQTTATDIIEQNDSPGHCSRESSPPNNPDFDYVSTRNGETRATPKLSHRLSNDMLFDIDYEES